MENNILISIIIPCYNDAQYIRQSVFSALNQTYPNIEVIVVDDGSDKETKIILKELEPQITKLITQENSGQSKARNTGIEAANGYYILVLDSDDFFEPRFCEKAIAVFENDLNTKLVSCYANLISENNTITVFKPAGGDIQSFLFSNAALGTSMFKKEDWNICGRYDETMRKGFEDWEFFIRLLKNGGNAHIIEEPLYNYRKRSNSTTQIANSKKFELQKYIYTKHKELYIQNYDSLVDFLLDNTQKEEKERVKILNKIDYRLGTLLLKPLRLIKKILK